MYYVLYMILKTLVDENIYWAIYGLLSLHLWDTEWTHWSKSQRQCDKPTADLVYVSLMNSYNLTIRTTLDKPISRKCQILFNKPLQFIDDKSSG